MINPRYYCIAKTDSLYYLIDWHRKTWGLFLASWAKVRYDAYFSPKMEESLIHIFVHSQIAKPSRYLTIDAEPEIEKYLHYLYYWEAEKKEAVLGVPFEVFEEELSQNGDLVADMVLKDYSIDMLYDKVMRYILDKTNFHSDSTNHWHPIYL